MEKKYSCCKPKNQERSPSESIELLDQTVFALDIRCRSYAYRCKEHEKSAKKYRAEGDMIRCKAELLRRFDLMQTYQKYMNLWTNVCRVRESLSDASAVGSIAGNMSIANRVLEEALKSVDPEKIEALMEQLEEGTNQMHEVASILGTQRITEEFDEQAALRELDIEEVEPTLILPVVPAHAKLLLQ